MAQTTKDMTPAQLDQYGADEFVKLQRAYGAALEEKLQSAAVMIHDLDVKQPGLKNLLRSRGIGNNALIVSMLVQQYAIYHARKGH